MSQHSQRYIEPDLYCRHDKSRLTPQREPSAPLNFLTTCQNAIDRTE